MRASVLLLVVMVGCAQPQTVAPPTPAAAANGPAVVFPDGHVIRVEVAADDEARAQGLMYRDRVREGTGMLFIFPTPREEHAFWMKNTLIPLDIVWIDDAKRVVHVKRDVPPCKADPCPSYSPGVAARYVLEVGAGVTREHGIDTGAVLTFRNLDRFQAR